MHQEPYIDNAAIASADESKKRRGFLKFPKTWKEVRRLGWKFVIAFILFYLIRDSILYLLLPYLIARGIFF